MIRDIPHLTHTYHAWLKDKSVLRQVDDWVEITTPFLDRHNDYVQIYAKRRNGGFILTEDGYTIDDLEQCGCKLEIRKRQDLLTMTLNGFGVRLDGKALQVHASPDNFALRKHNLVQAMLAVNDIFYLAVPMVARFIYSAQTVVLSTVDAKEVRSAESRAYAVPGGIIGGGGRGRLRMQSVFSVATRRRDDGEWGERMVAAAVR